MPAVDFSATTGNVLPKKVMFVNGLGMRSHSNSTLLTTLKVRNGSADKSSLDLSYAKEPMNNNHQLKGPETLMQK